MLLRLLNGERSFIVAFVTRSKKEKTPCTVVTIRMHAHIRQRYLVAGTALPAIALRGYVFMKEKKRRKVNLYKWLALGTRQWPFGACTIEERTTYD